METNTGISAYYAKDRKNGAYGFKKILKKKSLFG